MRKGQIAVAAVLGRMGYGMEIRPAYCDVALRRIANLTGEELMLANSGQTITEVSAERGASGEGGVSHQNQR
jgi:DNA modification methylase